jgi:hypothetical protein
MESVVSIIVVGTMCMLCCCMVPCKVDEQRNDRITDTTLYASSSAQLPTQGPVVVQGVPVSITTTDTSTIASSTLTTTPCCELNNLEC